MSKNKVEEVAKQHLDEAAEMAKHLFDTLDKSIEEHPQSNGEVLVAVGMFASMVLAHIFEHYEGMTARKAANETQRWASIVVSEVSDYFTKSEQYSTK